MDKAIATILFRIHTMGFAVRYEGDGQTVTFVATHRLAGHFFAYQARVGNEYEGVCILAEMCGLDPIEE